MPDEDFDDPRHIYQARAYRAAKDAERDLFREIESKPENTPVGMMLRALRGSDASPSELPDEGVPS
jgi:hypothetical protein